MSLNIKSLQDILGQEPSPHFAYPFGETTLPLKRALIPMSQPPAACVAA